jgi:uncharacterized membrane-anchored protein
MSSDKISMFYSALGQIHTLRYSQSLLKKNQDYMRLLNNQLKGDRGTIQDHIDKLLKETVKNNVIFDTQRS